MTGPAAPPNTLVVLTADKNAQFALRGILARDKSLGIQEITATFYIHPEKDPGTLRTAHEFLRPFIYTAAHALVVMDREGSGREELTRDNLEQQIEEALEKSGWGSRAGAVVVDPELDLWV